ncbi:serine hydroxymethyltransferase [Candidatus Bathyarchaeota archaeon]|nr:MAG: serine hydroxymethyltransferase [Candidatus Bathyarchaeota archaeon]
MRLIIEVWVLAGLGRIRRLIVEHHRWRGSCINLIASENITSPAVRETLASDFGHRYAEGEPYKRLYEGTRFFDDVEASALRLAKSLFKAEYVNIKPLSGCMANLAVFYALTSPGDTIMCLSVPSGGHISYMDFGGAGVRGLKVEYIPFDSEEMTIDLDEALDRARKVKPKVFMLGGSVFLFPHPVREFRELAEELGSYVVYDAAHVLGLMAGGVFQDPLREGADVVPSSTHKTFPGPQGGIILSNRLDLAESLSKAVFPGLTSNHHLHRVAALTIAQLEMKRYGRAYARSMVRNAKALAEALHEEGFQVLCEHKGFTESHQVLVDVSKLGGGRKVASMLERANIVCNRNPLPWDRLEDTHNPSGIRLGTPEVTRLGMGPSEMRQIAEYMRQVVIEGKPPERVAKEVSRFMRQYQRVKYCLEEGPAYKPPKIR